jgi:hypothetical protein
VSSERATFVERAVVGGVSAGLLAAAATAGALVGFGVREAAPARFLSAAGQPLRGVPSFVTPDRAFGVTAALGVVQHVVVVFAWALLFAAVAGRLRWPMRLLVGAAFAVIVYFVDAALPDVLRIAAGAVSPWQRAALVTLLAVAAVAGIRLAPPGGRTARRADA